MRRAPLPESDFFYELDDAEKDDRADERYDDGADDARPEKTGQTEKDED